MVSPVPLGALAPLAARTFLLLAFFVALASRTAFARALLRPNLLFCGDVLSDGGAVERLVR